VAYGIGSGAGWALAITVLAAIRERLAFSDVPEGLRGVGLAFLVTGLMSMSFGVFSAAGAP
jgi:Na+-transporting NADH:ubiquinone oxidoreductase subunit E